LILSFTILFQNVPVTFTGIEYVEGTDSLKVSFRIKNELFLRDYQQTVFDDLDLEVLRKFKPFPSDLANNYLNKRLGIYADKKEIVGKLLTMEVVDGDAKFNLLYRVSRKLKSITVRNNALTGLYADVENLVIVSMKNYESEIKLTPGHTEQTFLLK